MQSQIHFLQRFFVSVSRKAQVLFLRWNECLNLLHGVFHLHVEPDLADLWVRAARIAGDAVVWIIGPARLGYAVHHRRAVLRYCGRIWARGSSTSASITGLVGLPKESGSQRPLPPTTLAHRQPFLAIQAVGRRRCRSVRIPMACCVSAEPRAIQSTCRITGNMSMPHIEGQFPPIRRDMVEARGHKFPEFSKSPSSL